MLIELRQSHVNAARLAFMRLRKVPKMLLSEHGRVVTVVEVLMLRVELLMIWHTVLVVLYVQFTGTDSLLIFI